MADGSGTIANYLDFNVSRPPDELFNVERSVAERRLGLGLAAPESLLELCLGVNGPHAPAAATGNGLEHQRAMFPQKSLGFAKAHRLVDSLDQRNLAVLGQSPGCRFVAKPFQYLW